MHNKIISGFLLQILIELCIIYKKYIDFLLVIFGILGVLALAWSTCDTMYLLYTKMQCQSLKNWETERQPNLANISGVRKGNAQSENFEDCIDFSHLFYEENQKFGFTN